ncbi:MAG: hypothetical protein KA003_02220 [Caldilineaceae bacterium]|nr:hypothetical protein [Caldilineaceae bacterium]MBP8106134.1 hypothetical protein [Caldilineaceae bacterium]MBP8122288.1 hypothetical protein [Caldilineaceae bacterium]
MDIVSTALVSAAVAGLTSGTGKVLEKSLVDAYEYLKSIIVEKLGKNNDLIQAVENLEDKPLSNGRKETLIEEVSASNLNDDVEVLNAAKQLLRLVRNSADTEIHTQTATGDYIAQSDRNSTASVNVEK